MRNSLLCDENNNPTSSLLEGSIGVQLPKSKISSAAAMRIGKPSIKKKDQGEEGENIVFSDEETSKDFKKSN
jgi:hypothetical protein